MAKAPAPLFVDPIYNGAADPVPIWNRDEQVWWLLYTNRRATVEVPGYSWVHGTDIGIAATLDRGASWTYRGTCEFEPIEPGHNTFWAPEILFFDGLYHAYVSYVPGVPGDWNATRAILHYTSDNLWRWNYRSTLPLSSDRVIDACVFRMSNGVWRLWYKDEVNHSHTWVAESADLFQWRVIGPCITDVNHEGPNVFAWRGHYWMITDPWAGLGVYRSPDLRDWTRQPGNLLDRPGKRRDDGFRGSHADVLVQGDDAYLFYFVHPGGGNPNGKLDRNDILPYEYRRTSLQVAKLGLVDGNIVCDRDADFDFELKDEADA
ncbi:MAG: hypothetical protein QM770_23660 [Tepidisphaeraceae bacterium]